MNADKTAYLGRQGWLNIKVGLAMILAVGFFFLQSNSDTPVRGKLLIPAEKLPSSAHQNLLSFDSESGKSVTVTEEPIDWIDLAIKPLLVEVGGVMLYQVIGLPVMSIVSKVLWRSRRLLWLPYLHKMRLWSKMTTRIVQRTSKVSRFLRRVQKTAIRLYKKRSRLCIASEYTNLIGNDSGKEADEGSAYENQ